MHPTTYFCTENRKCRDDRSRGVGSNIKVGGGGGGAYKLTRWVGRDWRPLLLAAVPSRVVWGHALPRKFRCTRCFQNHFGDNSQMRYSCINTCSGSKFIVDINYARNYFFGWSKSGGAMPFPPWKVMVMVGGGRGGGVAPSGRSYPRPMDEAFLICCLILVLTS